MEEKVLWESTMNQIGASGLFARPTTCGFRCEAISNELFCFILLASVLSSIVAQQVRVRDCVPEH